MYTGLIFSVKRLEPRTRSGSTSTSSGTRHFVFEGLLMYKTQDLSQIKIGDGYRSHFHSVNILSDTL